MKNLECTKDVECVFNRKFCALGDLKFSHKFFNMFILFFQPSRALFQRIKNFLKKLSIFSQG